MTAIPPPLPTSPAIEMKSDRELVKNYDLTMAKRDFLRFSRWHHYLSIRGALIAAIESKFVIIVSTEILTLNRLSNWMVARCPGLGSWFSRGFHSKRRVDVVLQKAPCLLLLPANLWAGGYAGRFRTQPRRLGNFVAQKKVGQRGCIK